MTEFQLSYRHQRESRSGKQRPYLVARPRDGGKPAYKHISKGTLANRLPEILAWIESQRDEETPPATTIIAELGLADLIFRQATT